MVAIGVYQLLSNSAMYELSCLENVKKLYKYSGKCDDQQQYKAIIKAAKIYTTKNLTENLPIDVDTLETLKNPGARKSLSQFLELLDVKKAVRILGAPKTERKAIRKGSDLWSSIRNQRGNTKINSCLKQALYSWVLHHLQVVHSPISN